eukprot:1363231-Pyramimonas_sp.AAC.1
MTSQQSRISGPIFPAAPSVGFFVAGESACDLNWARGIKHRELGRRPQADADPCRRQLQQEAPLKIAQG